MQISRMTEEERLEEDFASCARWLNLFAKFVNIIFAIVTDPRDVQRYRA